MEVAQTGGAIAGQAVDAVSRLETALQKISDIIRLIDDVAFQTNLTALNAAMGAPAQRGARVAMVQAERYL
ncbi:methyl-accepting chemotaxis protein [Bosea sp. (in: a-proteobacteria)]|uniref:methyl-accepting chemotaxis protein n=1 Tax=Bosea sp. (in: a-proteobacteria) TaxID=1871050 RepID=UPI002B46BCBA|nr:methyl-accepting chemotaxis protein [Bosea sp. (in: a-proteobacteria)]WRH60036.1 MAG: methyl-accepting chemotaxis protein [Bosea sp. (in: a-proteobacteria)]